MRLGLVGIGIIAEDYLGIISQGMVPEVTITALCSRQEVKLRSVQERYHLNCSLFTDYVEMLKSGTIDGVLIATPHGQHPKMTKQALECGVHVLVEKPVGIYGDEVAPLVRLLSNRPELVCGVLYNRRASQAFRFVKQLMDDGTVGNLIRASWIISNLYRTEAYYKTSSWRGHWSSEGGGILMTQASHQLDLMQWVCGFPDSVLARCRTVERPIRVENEAELLFTYPNGARGYFFASAHESPGTNLLEIAGTRGTIRVRDDSLVEVIRLEQDSDDFARICPNSFQQVPCTTETYVFDDRDNKVQQAATISNFANAVAGKATVACSLEDGLRSLQIIHGAYLSNWQNKTMTLPISESDFRTQLLKADL